LKRLSNTDIESIYQIAKSSGKIDGSEKSLIFYSKELLEDRLAILSRCFPKATIHAVAIKAQSHPDVLRYIVELGYGLEAASIEEVKLAIAAGCANDKIVFDSPVKTRDEILYCHESVPGLHLNVNSLAELVRIPENFSGKLGIRINPLVETDAPEIFDVVKKNSKFGVPVTKKQDIIDACMKYPVSGLHIHIGSGIRDFSGNVAAVKMMVDLADEINRLKEERNQSQRIDWIDIGGGIHFESEEGEFSVREFTETLKKDTAVFERYKVITEYGAYVHKHNSFAVSRIEYVLESELKDIAHTAFIHLGADLFLRKVYALLPIQYPCFVLGKENLPKTEKYNVAGPLCFAGDYLYYDLLLPKLNEGDLFVIENIGANTLSMWSRHCSREEPGFVFWG
jgi:diaminopimelate decarboxylase